MFNEDSVPILLCDCRHEWAVCFGHGTHRRGVVINETNSSYGSEDSGLGEWEGLNITDFFILKIIIIIITNT